MSLTDQYSGIVVNQNATTSGEYAWRTQGGNWLYQTFTLPSDYQRGTDADELRIPDLSGFQIFVTVDAGFASSAAVDYTLSRYGGVNLGWLPMTSGTVIGAHTDGLAWMDLLFPQSVPISIAILDSQFRLGLHTRTATDAAFKQAVRTIDTNTYVVNDQTYTANLIPGIPFPITVGGLPAFLLLSDSQVTYSIQQGVSSIGYVTPTPLVQQGAIHGQAFQTDSLTPLLGVSTTSSLNFRALGLVADSGTDFLNNEYRSCVTTTAVGNTDTTRGATPVQGSGNGTYWMSPPLPSRFAVKSLYFDQRSTSANPIYGPINNIGNPSFEYDGIGLAPLWWSSFTSGGTTVDQTAHGSTPWVFDGVQTLHMKYTFTAANQQRGIISPFQTIASTSGGASTPVSISLAYDLITSSNAPLVFSLLFYDASQTLLPSPYGTYSLTASTTGAGTISGSTTVPSSAVYVRYLVSALSSASGSFEGYIDGVQATFTNSVLPYFDGDHLNCQWTTQRGQSPSVQLIASVPGDESVVIDGIMVDPITPNMAFNVYYSVDDANTSDNMSETDWEQKLWARVPQVFVCTQRQQYVFPTPVKAKYMKVEFTNLQGQSYTPGDFQKPVRYKKFPTWVANYFVSQLELPSFVASQVDVQYDALGFAYDYYLDDLRQAPDSPTAEPQDIISQLTTYFYPTTGNSVDPTTLAQINLAMKPFASPLGTYVNQSTALGSYVAGLLASATPPVTTTEGGSLTPVDYSVVSGLQREPVILEQALPVMYFFIQCRHTYKELTASFDFNRAYFAGVSEISFLRNNYGIADDTSLYIETGGDTTNIVFTDWSVDSDNNWYAYGD